MSGGGQMSGNDATVPRQQQQQRGHRCAYGALLSTAAAYPSRNEHHHVKLDGAHGHFPLHTAP